MAFSHLLLAVLLFMPGCCDMLSLHISLSSFSVRPDHENDDGVLEFVINCGSGSFALCAIASQRELGLRLSCKHPESPPPWLFWVNIFLHWPLQGSHKLAIIMYIWCCFCCLTEVSLCHSGYCFKLSIWTFIVPTWPEGDPVKFLVHLHFSLPLLLTVLNHQGRMVSFLLTQVLRVSCVGWPDLLLCALLTFPNSFAWTSKVSSLCVVGLRMCWKIWRNTFIWESML